MTRPENTPTERLPEPYYSDDSVTLYRGDCMELQSWLKADVLVTDPPYGYSHRSGGGPRGHASWRNAMIANDESTATRDWALNSWASTGACGSDRPALVFGHWKSNRPKIRTMLIWDKGGHRGMGDLSLPWKPNFEEIYVIGSGFTGTRTSGVIGGHHLPSSEAAGRSHPHEKPVSLMVELISKCPPGVVADPFAGSGSTLLAAKLIGRKAIGVEYDEAYCELIAKRLSQGVLDFGGVA